MDASGQAPPPAEGAPAESQDSIYARNRAIYEASMKQQQEQQQQQQAIELNDGIPHDKQARPREDDDAGAAGDDAQPPAKKKLIRAGDLAAAQQQAADSGAASPALGPAATIEPPASAASAASGPAESMREKLSRASRSGSGSPFVAQPQYSTAGSPATSVPSGTPQLQPGVGISGGGANDVETVIEVNTLAFCTKNPSIDARFVREALRHSKGAFNQDFQTALRLLVDHKQQNGAPTSGSPSLGQTAAFSPPPVQSPRYPGQQASLQPTQQSRYPGHVPATGAPPQQMILSATSRMSPPAPGGLHAHQMPGPPGTAGAAINGHSAAALQLQARNQQQSPAALGGLQPPSQPMPPAQPVGTHPAIGFSALQVLPEAQHSQFYQLAPQQQTDYSMQVFQSLSAETREGITNRYKAAEALRQQWQQWCAQTGLPPQYAQPNAQQAPQGQPQQANGQVMIPPRGGAQNPYSGYSTQAPTAQHQLQQQRFPGQNPVFRVGAAAPQAGGAGQGQAQQPRPQSQIPAHQPPYPWFQQAQTSMLSQMSPEARQKFHEMSQQEQYNYVVAAVLARQEQAQRAKNQQQQQLNARQKQQKAMADSHQAAKGGNAPQAMAQKKKKKRNQDASDDSDALNLHDDDTDDERDDDDADNDDGSEAEAEREEAALKWFNEAKAEELMEMTACSPEAASAVLEMRPYLSTGDVRAKLRKRKGVSGNLFDNYVDLMHSYTQTDECLAKCTKIGEELLEVMRIWTGGKKIDPTPSMRPSAEPEDVKPVAEIKVEPTTDSAANGDIKVEIKPENQEETKPSNAFLTVPGAENETSAPAQGTSSDTMTAENTANIGTGLTELSEDVLQESTKQDASAEVKKAFEGYIYTQPKLLADNFKLKAYQLLGVNWLSLLYRKNISCILADEMGLGKTAQVISLIAHLKETGKSGPHLVIVPSSTLDNWLREFENFAPSLKVYAYYGSQLERADSRFFLKQQEDLDVIVTTYNMATGAPDDRKFLKKMEFKACVFDEGHQLKNAESKKYKDLMEIKVGWRLLLTGTPLQNNLQELVSLLSFILPKIFSEAQESLRAIFKVPPEAQKNLLTRQRVRAAKKVMTPFVLRRKKAQVLQDLPPKKEIVEYCDMTPTQRAIYRETLATHKKAVVEYQPSGTNTPAEEPQPKKRGRAAAKKDKPAVENTTSNILMSLRKAANHPMLFRRLYDDKKIKQMAKDCLKEEEFADRNVDYIYEDMEIMTDFELHRLVKSYKHIGKYALKKDEWMEAGKIHKLKEMLPPMKERGDRILIFSQFVQVLDILQQVLETMGMKFLVLTGQTNVNDRQALVDEFTEDDSITCFLLSTRAGGLGLNLMAANTVIIMDMDFNPHNDKQAMDRTYRIGQKREVTIYKFVTRGTIEEDMLALATTKLALDEQVSAESAVSGDMAGNIEIDESTEGVIEKKVKSSLMSTLQARFDGGDADFQSTQAPSAATDGDVKMEAVDGAADTADGEATPAVKNGKQAAKGRQKIPKLAPKREKPQLDDDGEELEEEGADDAASSAASDAGSEYDGNE